MKHGKRDPGTLCPECQRPAVDTQRGADLTVYECASGHRWYIGQGGERFQVVRVIPGKAGA